MSPVQRAVTSVLRLMGATCLLFSVLVGGLAAYHFHGAKPGFPWGLMTGATALLVSGVAILLKSSSLAARLTQEDEE